MVEHILVCAQIEILMLHEANRGGPVGCRAQFEPQAIATKGIGGGKIDIAGIAHGAVGRKMGEAHRIIGAVDLTLPDLPSQPLIATMQLQLARIGRQLIGHAIELEAGTLDAIGHAAGQRPEMRAMGGIGAELVKAQHDRALTPGHRDAPVTHHHAIADNVDTDPGIAGQAELIHPLPVVLTET